MIKISLQDFCNRIVAQGAISLEDVRELGRTLLPDGFRCREEADMLIALERAVASVDPAFGTFLTAAVVDFAVWGERPTGYVDADLAHWLAASLTAGRGPTPLGVEIAREVIREAESSHEQLLACALSGSARAGAPGEAWADAA
ncbi:hypothetical protein OPKNFCMD_2565 [Methylobacterium crusticola]|uniref:DUF2267 domain-containing protein n=1 Tax=Methylobacterium crusticola TaxID=1697972 RepID=A0ABQ4QWU5_9HYPH|nr:hypothetical protein [Methylobacterium crusticola]GJD49831.1 hypothetical protein OPKNFCMD_2565 [Methylobacterium crusticola]